MSALPDQQELRRRNQTDPLFATLVRTVYASIERGETSIQDWRDAVNLAYTEWHYRNVGPIYWIPPVAAQRER